MLHIKLNIKIHCKININVIRSIRNQIETRCDYQFMGLDNCCGLEFFYVHFHLLDEYFSTKVKVGNLICSKRAAK